MSITVHNKLVRDKIPEIITANGDIPATRVLDTAEYREALFAKLGEESDELRAAEGEAELWELADLQEVLNALAESYGYSPHWVGVAAEQKRQKRGGFRQRIYLEHTTPAT